MNSKKLRDWLEILGLFSVVASLVFVGLQMRQAHKISLSETYQSRTAAAAEWNSSFAANPVAMSAYRKGFEQRGEDITVDEHQALRRMIVGVLHLYDNAHYQYQQGFVSDEFWSSTRDSLRDWLLNETFNPIVMERIDLQGRPEFKAMVHAINDKLAAGTREKTSEPDPDMATIASIRALSNEAIARHNALTVASFLAPEYQITTGKGLLFQDTPEQEVEGWQDVFATADDIIYVRTPQTIEVSTYLPRAAEHGTWVGSWTTEAGRKEVGGSYAATWSKIDDEWKILSEVFVTLFCNGPGC